MGDSESGNGDGCGMVDISKDCFVLDGDTRKRKISWEERCKVPCFISGVNY